jgi:sigma-B regulation protein RsbU (phosphoserine phosphatase)
MMTAATPTDVYCLEILLGSSRGQRIELHAPSILLGRHETCDLVLDDPAVSRRHARIERRTDGFYLSDLHSLNGTTLNGRRVRRAQRLDDGDLIHIHKFVLAFVSGGRDTSSEHSALLSGRMEGSASSAPHQPTNSEVLTSLRCDGRRAEGPAAEGVRTVRHIVRYLGVSFATDEVAQRLLEGLFSIFPQAERGEVLLRESSGQLGLRGLKVRKEDGIDSLTVGPLALKMAMRVMEQEEAVLTLQQPDDQESPDEVMGIGPRWSMYAPLIGIGAIPAGIVRLDSSDGQHPFNEADLETFVVAALVGGQALDYALAATPARSPDPKTS